MGCSKPAPATSARLFREYSPVARQRRTGAFAEREWRIVPATTTKSAENSALQECLAGGLTADHLEPRTRGVATPSWQHADGPSFAVRSVGGHRSRSSVARPTRGGALHGRVGDRPIRRPSVLRVAYRWCSNRMHPTRIASLHCVPKLTGYALAYRRPKTGATKIRHTGSSAVSRDGAS